MKHGVWGFFMAFIALIIILIIISVVGRMTRSTEATSTLSEAVEQSVNSVMHDKTYTINNKDEFIADVMQNLLNSYENNAAITIKIATADKDKGLLGLKVIEEFRKPNGSVTKEEYDKVVLLETDEGESTYTISYVLEDGSIFQKLSVNGGENLILPKVNPEGVTKWAKVNKDGTQTVMTTDEIKALTAGEDITFIAVTN